MNADAKTSIELPVAVPPLVSFPFIANSLSVLFAYKDSTLPWFSDRYIQLVINKDITKGHDLVNFYDTCGSNNINTVDYCPFFISQRIDGLVKNQSFDKFADFAIEQLNCGYYIHVLLNQRDIESSLNESSHQTFLYGYDSRNKKIMMNYFDRLGRYFMNHIVGYDEVDDSFKNRKMDKNDVKYKKFITLLKYNDYDYTINLELMNLSIRDYRYSKDSMLKWNYAFKERNDYVFGLDYYNVLVEHCKLRKIHLEAKAFHVLYEHKLAMKIRLKYLNSIGFISDLLYEKINDYCEKLVKQSLALRNYAIKYKLCGDSNDENDKHLNVLLKECSDLYRLDKDFTVDLIFLLS